jgi:hypothetical protein
MKSIGQTTDQSANLNVRENLRPRTLVFILASFDDALRVCFGSVLDPIHLVSVRDNLQLESEPVFAQEICRARSWE